MAFAVLLHRTRQHRLDLQLEQRGEHMWFLVAKTSRAMRQARYRTLRRTTRVAVPLTAITIGAAAALLDRDLTHDPPRHQFEAGQG